MPVIGSNGVVGHHDESLISGPGIVVGRKGSAGSAIWIDSDFWPIDTTYYVDKIAEDIDIQWLYYAISMLRLDKLSEGPVPGLNRHSAAELAIRLPPRREQRKIAAVLSSVDNAINKTRAVIGQACIVKRALMQELFKPAARQGRKAQNRRQSIRLGEVVDQRTAKLQPTPDDTRPYVGLEHLAQGMPTILGWFESNQTSSAKTVFRAGDVLFGKLRPKLRKAALAPFDGVCSTDIVPLYCRGEDLKERYLLQLVHSYPFRRHAIATASGTKMPRTSWKELREFTFRLPSLDEQCETVAVLSSVDDVVARSGAAMRGLSVVKRALMPVLLTGELRVTPDSIAA